MEYPVKMGLIVNGAELNTEEDVLYVAEAIINKAIRSGEDFEVIQIDLVSFWPHRAALIECNHDPSMSGWLLLTNEEQSEKGPVLQ